MKSELSTIYTTFANQKEAISVARLLLERELVACANIHENITSLYRWQGEIKQERETACIFKTRKEKCADAVAAIKQLHPYEIPCIVVYEVEATPEFADWVAGQTP